MTIYRYWQVAMATAPNGSPLSRLLRNSCVWCKAVRPGARGPGRLHMFASRRSRFTCFEFLNCDGTLVLFDSDLPNVEPTRVFQKIIPFSLILRFISYINSKTQLDNIFI